MTSIFGDPSIVVCDDIAPEAADFIMAYEKEQRVVFIHAKGNNALKASKCAASKLLDVCGQATKNIKYLGRYVNDPPPKAKKWHTASWKANADGKGKVIPTGEVKQRIRLQKGKKQNGVETWNQVRSIIRNPNATLEVWLFLGRLLSKSSFEKRIQQNMPDTYVKQTGYLLFSTMNDIAAVGAKLKVICST